MRRLRTFCSASLVLVIYHANARESVTETPTEPTDANASRPGAHVDSHAGDPARSGAGSALADVCSEGGGSFFDGVVQFSEEGDATFDPVAGRCT